jgi:hypothetical protein
MSPVPATAKQLMNQPTRVLVIASAIVIVLVTAIPENVVR